MYSNELIRGTLKPIVLKLLSENEKMYGYEISQKVRVITNDEIRITEGALYPLLHKLEKEKIVSTEKIKVGKRVRKYYKLTKNGKAIALERVEELKAFIGTIKNILNTNPRLA